MFTGLIERQGEVIENHFDGVANRLLIRASFDSLQIGESIAVNGVCLTLASQTADILAFDVSPETRAVTTLHMLKPQHWVNLERAMLMSTRLGGHYVSGHVDATALLQHVSSKGDYLEIVVGNFSLPAAQYLIPKGGITLDGVNLTINEVIDDKIHIMLVPHTLSVTTFGKLKTGHRVNVEFDYLARIVAHQLKFAIPC